MVVAGATFAITQVPALQKATRDSAREAAVAQALAASSRIEVDRSLSSVADGSAADRYLKAILWVWTAEADAVGTSMNDFTAGGGSMEQSLDGFRVCYPGLGTMPETCVQVSAFVHDADTGLVNRFSLDGVPVDRLVSGSSDVDALGNEGGLEVRAAVMGDLKNASRTRRCVVVQLTDPRDTWDEDKIRFRRASWDVRDMENAAASGRVAWPKSIGIYDEKAGAACIDETAGGFVLVGARLEKKLLWGFLRV
ncbi:MAG: hypothetical protein IT193_16980 [Propionibacteriaceae bacterium]|nr:hypothetical protein [Propionibacteriaceae bacterium]